jgi:hypothetical protein
MLHSIPSLNCKMVIMSKTNPDPGNSMHEKPVSFYNQYEKDVSMGLPSTQKSEEMVAVGSKQFWQLLGFFASESSNGIPS